MEKSLDELLGGDAPEPIDMPEAEAPAEAPEPAVEAQPRDESGRFASKGVEPQEPADTVPPTDKGLPKDVYEPLRAVRDENKQLRAALDALESQIASLQQPKEPEAPPPSVWEDENAWGGNLVSQAVQQATLNARLDMSEMMVRQANPDFEEVKAEFLRLAEANPTLRQQALSDPHPWNKAYQIAKNHRTMQELGSLDVDALKAKMREELMAEIQGQAPARPSVPPTLANERNVGTRTGPAWSGPKSLDDLLR